VIEEATDKVKGGAVTGRCYGSDKEISL